MCLVSALCPATLAVERQWGRSPSLPVGAPKPIRERSLANTRRLRVLIAALQVGSLLSRPCAACALP